MKKGNSFKDSVFSLFFTIPLSTWFDNNLQATWNSVSRPNQYSEQQFGLKGQFFDRQLAWNISKLYIKDRNTNTNTNVGSLANIEWSGKYGKVRGEYSENENFRNLAFSLDGGLIAHGDGITIGQSFSDSVALTEALGAVDVSVGGWPGIRTDLRGYALVPNLNNYQINNVKLDTTLLSNRVEILNNERNVIPTAGAIVKVKFNTMLGVKAIVKIKNNHGKYLPLGSQVYIKGKEALAGIIDSEGQVYLSGLDNDSQLIVIYHSKTCTTSNRLIKDDSRDYLQNIIVTCT